MASVTVVSPPTWEPIGVDELRAHARIDGTEEDPLLARYIRVAREWAELKTGRTIAEQTLEVRVDSFESALVARTGSVPAGYADSVSGGIVLPGPPIQTVLEVGYSTTTGAVIVSSSAYDFTAGREPAVLVPDPAGADWPAGVLYGGSGGNVYVRYVAGYPTADRVPETIAHWILITATQLYEQRTPLSEVRLERTVLDWMLYPSRRGGMA